MKNLMDKLFIFANGLYLMYDARNNMKDYEFLSPLFIKVSHNYILRSTVYSGLTKNWWRIKAGTCNSER